MPRSFSVRRLSFRMAVPGRIAARSIPLAGLLGLTAATAHAVSPADRNTGVRHAGNGVTIVDIATPNTAGVSHNRHHAYDVAASGLVLNNAAPGQAHQPSVLAGALQANARLHRPADVILNEVVSTNRSLLAGPTEVYGGRADVVVANPNGITCAGCEFLNTERVTLTTGAPQFDAVGALVGLDVTRGDVAFERSPTGTGMMRGPTTLDVVARVITVDSTVQARDLSLLAGTNRYDYRARQLVGTTSPTDGHAQPFAIDSTSLGGMYGERIRLVATEQGTGVRTRGAVGGWHTEVTVQSKGEYVQQGLLWGANLALSSDGHMKLESLIRAGNTLRVRAKGIFIGGQASVWAGNIDFAAEGRQPGVMPLLGDGKLLNLGDVVSATRIQVAADLGVYSPGRLFGFGDVRVQAPWVMGDRSRMGMLYVNGSLTERSGGIR